LLRRTARGKASLVRSHFQCHGLKIDYTTKTVTLDDNPVKLTSIEYNLLYFLTTNAGQVLPHDFLLTKVWGPEYQDAIEYLKVHVRHLREKLHDDAQNPHFIFTERSKGYRFAAVPYE
jgi:two-component system KDP operon response regulator KdpE